MLSQELGFMSSWKMLTRDKGWIKPILVLTLVGWIPILGQIAVLGYALEWARLTAWGVDAAPKQRGIDFGKLFSTGGRAFLVVLSISLVVGLVLGIVFPGSLAVVGNRALNNASAFSYMGGLSISMLLVMAVSVFAGSFGHAAALRATLYDSFAAGWRIDRLFQMIVRDFGGFFHAFAVMLIGSLIASVYATIVGLLAAIVALSGAVGVSAVYSLSGGYFYDSGEALSSLLTLGAAPVLLCILIGIVLLFIGAAISTAMQLIGINAMGQWFCRFEVNRWGASSAPLPDDVPRSRAGGWGAQAPEAPRDPASSGGASAAAATWPPRDADAGASSVTIASDSSTPSDGGASVAEAASQASEAVAQRADEDTRVVDAPSESEGAAGAAAAMQGGIPMPPVSGQERDEHEGASIEDRALTGDATSDADAEAAADKAVAVATTAVGEAEVGIKADDDGLGEREPIPLGPISTDEQEPEHDGPILP